MLLLNYSSANALKKVVCMRADHFAVVRYPLSTSFSYLPDRYSVTDWAWHCVDVIHTFHIMVSLECIIRLGYENKNADLQRIHFRDDAGSTLMMVSVIGTVHGNDYSCLFEQQNASERACQMCLTTHVV